jgi:hypothetical protein
MSKTPKNSQSPCDLLTAYEMGLLENQERTSFEAHLDDCVDCLDGLYALAPAVLEMQKNPGQYASAMERSLAGGKSSPMGQLQDLLGRLFNVRVLVPLAVTAVAVLVIINPFSGVDSVSQLADMTALPYTKIEVRSGGSSNSADDFKSAMVHYQNTDYCAAAPLLVQALAGEIKPVAANDQGTLYAGVSYLLCGQNEQAIVLLKDSAASGIPPVAQKSLWYLAQAQLRSNNSEAAITALKLLSDSPVYGDQAKDLLANIKNTIQ